MRDRLFRVEAIILKRTDSGEADRLLTLYTPEMGKLRTVAKGVRKPSSRKGGHVELFTHSMLLVAKGRQLDIVTQADTLDAFMPLRENLDRLGYAYYLAELVDQFTEEGTENRAVFDLLLHALGWLGESPTDPALLAHFFEIHLLEYVGYRPQLFNCVHCGTPLEPVQNYFSAEAGGVLDPNCVQNRREEIPAHGRDAQMLSLNALKVMRYLQTREWDTIRTLRLTTEVLSEVEVLMQRYLTHLLERNLKSVAFLRELRKSLNGAVAEVDVSRGER